jgi:hypothetical protein
LWATAFPAEDKPLFHSDPDHPWNRAHRFLYLAEGNAGIDNQERLEPFTLGGGESRFLAKGASPQKAIELLDAFLASDEARQIKDPLKRAIFQHDLWRVFTDTTGPALEVIRAQADGRTVNTKRFADYGDSSLGRRAERRALQKRLVQAMRMAALTAEEIQALSDNLASAVKGGLFPSAFDPKHPERPYLPTDLLSKDGSWVIVTNPAETTDQGTLGAPTHVASFKGRSVFTVLIRLPGGRAKTEAFVKELSEGKLPPLPSGSQTALLRRMLLIDANGHLRPTALTESLQLRVYEGPEDTGAPVAIRLARSRLIAGKSDNLQSLNSKELSCVSCHARHEGNGVRSIASLYAGERQQPGLSASDLKTQEASTIAWTEKTYAWGLLQGLWESDAGR